MFVAVTISLPSVFIGASRWSKANDSSHSTQLYEEYAPPESIRNDSKVASSYTFHGEAVVE
jgi:hypothetical protein